MIGSGPSTAGRLVSGMLLATLTLISCAVEQRASESETAPVTVPASEARPLVILTAVEPNTVATRSFLQRSTSLRATLRVFNAGLALIDARGVPNPELLASLPSLNTESWQVFPDGSMQTAYTLRPNLTWHDDQPLTADDFVFGWRVYSNPDLGVASLAPWPVISSVAESGGERFVIRWKAPYPDANTLSQYQREFPPLPQHILGTAFDQIATAVRDPFVTHAYWGPQFVGLGPYRIQQWEPGAFIDAVRFDGYALGAPKIPRIQLRFSNDQNVVFSSLLAGEAHVAMDSAIAQNPEILAQQWARSNGGTVLQLPSSYRAMMFQLRPELATPRAIVDLRVRRALAHAVDKQAISDAVYDGEGIFADGPIWKGSALGNAIDNSIPTYPFDLQASASLMNQAGLSKGSDGFYRLADGTDTRLSLELATTASASSVRELAVMADEFGVAGFDIQQRVIPIAQAQDAQLRATFPGLQNLGSVMGEAGVEVMASSQIPTAANRWLGQNRGGWTSHDYDRLLAAFATSLDRGERVTLLRQLLRVYSEELPALGLFFPAGPVGYVAAVRGPANTAPESIITWNIHQWEFS